MTALLPPFGTPAGELARAALVVLGFGGLFAGAEVWRRRAAPPVEWTRKLVHIGGGVICGTFPFLFAHAVTVFAIAALSVGALLFARRHDLVPSVTDVERRSRGEVWFPVGVGLLFSVARHEPVFYLIALSALVLADSAAALIGRRYGRLAYEAGGDRKSLEGSAMFALVTFLAVHVALLLGTPVERGASLLVAAQIALLVASFEAISMHGNDNLVVPLGTYYLLLKMAHQPASAIGLQLAAQLGLLAMTLLLAWRTRFLSLAGAIAAHLVLYAAFSLGGPLWTLAPLGALAGFLALDHRYAGSPGVQTGGHQVLAIYYTSIVAMLVLFADNSFATLLHGPESLRFGHPFQPLFVGALAAPLAIAAYELSETESVPGGRSPAVRGLRAFAIAAFAVLLPGLVVLGTHTASEALLIATLAPIAALPLHLALRGRVDRGRGLMGRLRVASIATLVAVVATLALHFAWSGIRPWEGRS